MRALASSRNLPLFILALIFITLYSFRSNVSDGLRTKYTTSRPDSNTNELANAPQIPLPAQHTEKKKAAKKPSSWGTRIQWDGNKIPQTTMLGHKSGGTVFDRIYMKGGTWFIVTDDPESMPPLVDVIGIGVDMSLPDLPPTDKDIQIISPEKAVAILGHSALQVPGASFVFNEAAQFVTHYYHFVAESFVVNWRTYVSLDTTITPSGITHLPPVSRIIFPHITSGTWRDRAGMNGFFLSSVFPSAAIWNQEEWQSYAHTEIVYSFDRIVISERVTVAHSPDWHKEWKVPAVSFGLPGSPDWWAPIRRNILLNFGWSEKDLTSGMSKGPVITYIARQHTGRSLLEPDHEALVKALEAMRDKYHWEVNIAEMEKLTKREQIELSARTTIMMGVHGNGLTHMMWMERTPRSAVFEFSIPGGYANDYSFTARACGFRFFGFWNDKYHEVTNEKPMKLNFPEGFHSENIPLGADAVVGLVVKILTEKES